MCVLCCSLQEDAFEAENDLEVETGFLTPGRLFKLLDVNYNQLIGANGPRSSRCTQRQRPFAKQRHGHTLRPWFYPGSE